VRGSAIVTDSVKATYVLLICRSKREFFLHWWSLPAIQKAARPKNVINHKDYLFSFVHNQYLAFTKKHNFENVQKGEKMCSIPYQKFLKKILKLKGMPTNNLIPVLFSVVIHRSYSKE